MRIKKKHVVSLAVILVLALGVCAWVVYQKAYFYTTGVVYDFGPIPYEPKVPMPAIQGGSVWLHRVNSVERVQHFMNDFDGFEIDVYYVPERDIFNVDHDNRDFNTSLDDMFTALQVKPGVYVWLDVKFLHDDQVEAAEKRMAWLLEKHNFPKDHFIVELPNWRHCQYFGDKGYLTTFDYWPGDDWTPEQVEASRQDYIRSGASAMTVEIIHYDLAKSAFPGIPKLVWDMKSYNRQPLTYLGTLLRQRVIFDDPDVRVHLVGDWKLRR